MPRIHILGASGAGATTLGGRVALLLGVPHLDTDAFHWTPADPPYTTPRPVSERLALLRERLTAAGHWVLSGSAIGWAKPVEPMHGLLVYLRLDPEIRMERLRCREQARHGQRIEPGGDMAAGSTQFLVWAAAYDTAGLEQRSRAAHENWLATQVVPVLRLDSSKPVDVLARAVMLAAQPEPANAAGSE